MLFWKIRKLSVCFGWKNKCLIFSSETFHQHSPGSGWNIHWYKFIVQMMLSLSLPVKKKSTPGCALYYLEQGLVNSIPELRFFSASCFKISLSLVMTYIRNLYQFAQLKKQHCSGKRLWSILHSWLIQIFCSVCFVIICTSSLPLLVPLEGCFMIVAFSGYFSLTFLNVKRL